MSPTETIGAAAEAPAFEAVWPGGVRTELALGDVLAEGGDARIHGVDGRDDLVAKVYRDAGSEPQRRAKLNAMLASPPEGRAATYEGETYVELAWPVALVERGAPRRSTEAPDDSLPAGFLMPRVDLSRAVLLDLFLNARARRSQGLPEGVRDRVTVAHNLAASVAALHDAGHHVIDLKPANVHVYRDTQFVAILDCDGFSVAGPDGARFPAHQYTEGYIAPESMASRPEALGENQDRFALAVVLFGLLNRGLHPFQGVPAPGASVPTTDAERAAAGLYPYGTRASKALTPPPQSRYAFLDASTRRLFDDAFSGTPDRRPTAAVWRDHLRTLLTTTLRPCRHNPDHARFGRHRCGLCALDREREARLSKAKRASKPPPAPPEPQQAPSSPRPARAASPSSGRRWGAWRWALIGCGIIAVIVFANDPPPPFDDAPVRGRYEIETQQLRDAVLEGNVWSARAITEAVSDPYILGYVDASVSRRDASVPYAPVREPDTEFSPARITGCSEPPDMRNVHQASVLTLAAERSHAAMVAMLIEQGARPERYDPSRGESPLMTAAAACTLVGAPSDTVVTALADLANRLTPNANPEQERAEFARIVRNDDRLQSLRDDIDSASVERIGDLGRNAAVLTALIAGGASVDASDVWGRTPLFYAAAAGNAVAVRVLLDSGADPNAVDNAGATPLMAAADQAASEASDRASVLVVAELLRGGAAAATRDDAERTAADYVGNRRSTSRVLASRSFSDRARNQTGLPPSLAEYTPAFPGDAALENMLLGTFIRSETLGLLQTGRRNAVSLDRDEALRADLGDFGTLLPDSPSIGFRPVAPPARAAASQRLSIDCPGVAAGAYTIRVTYARVRSSVSLGRVHSVAPLDWPPYPRQIEAAVQSGRASTLDRPGVRGRAACFLSARDELNDPASITGERERWPTFEIPVIVRPASPSSPPPPPPPPSSR